MVLDKCEQPPRRKLRSVQSWKSLVKIKFTPRIKIRNHYIVFGFLIREISELEKENRKS